MPLRMQLDSASQQIADLLASQTGHGAALATLVVTAGVDTLAPAAPATVSVSSASYTGQGGVQGAEAIISWSAVTTNSDGSACTDLDGYLVSYKNHAALDWSGEQYIPAGTTVVGIPGFALGQVIDARVRAQDKAKPPNRSAYTTSLNTALTTDTTAPNQPSTPTVTGVLAGIRVVWDGKDSSGNPMPADFGHYEVHQSTTSGFTPSATTLVDSLPTAGGASTIPLNDYGTPHYVKIIAVDLSGNASTPSAQASGTPTQAVDLDILTAAITSAKIATSAVTADKLTQATLGDNRILNGNVEDANAAGTGPAAWTSGYDATGAPTYVWTSAINGSKSIGVTSTTTGGGSWASTPFPVTPGGILAVKCFLKASATTGASAYVRLFYGTTSAMNFGSGRITATPAVPTQVSAIDVTSGASLTGLGTNARANGIVELVQAWNPGTTDIVVVTGQSLVPASASWAQLVVYNWSGGASTVYYDDLNVQPVMYGPAIADASIITAKIANAAVGTAQIANAAIVNALIGTAAVGTANIASLAVTDAKIGDCSITKLTAGTLSADLTVSARIKTANSGQRSEIDAHGFHVYNASNVEVCTLGDVAGTLKLSVIGGTITGGVVQTATSGQRVVLDGSTNTIALYNSLGSNVGSIRAQASPDEILIEAGGNTISVGSGGGGIANTGGGTPTWSCGGLSSAGPVDPTVDNTYELGSPSFRWASINVNTLGASGSVSMSGLTVATVAVAAGFGGSSNTTLLRASSSRRYKQDITYDEKPDYSILDLRPVTYADRYEEHAGKRFHGLIAEDVIKTHPLLVVLDDDGKPGSLMYERISPLLLPVVRDMNERLGNALARLARLEGAA